MAHKKGGGAKAVQKGNVAGKRLGVKVSGGSVIKAGQIIIRQRGRQIIPGRNVEMGKDFTLYSIVNGIVKFGWVTKKRKKVSVIETTKKIETVEKKEKVVKKARKTFKKKKK
jgi:large subunit ribosomal protein L27